MPLKQIDGSFHKHIFEARYNFSIECRQNCIQVVVQIFLAFSITHARFSFFLQQKYWNFERREDKLQSIYHIMIIFGKYYPSQKKLELCKEGGQIAIDISH